MADVLTAVFLILAALANVATVHYIRKARQYNEETARIKAEHYALLHRWDGG